ncbi:MAG: FAD-dependent oxidoreductase [Stappiaceae bacterium]
MKETLTHDVAIIGAGIFGLSIARRCAQNGKRVVLIDKAAVGQGASGGVLGALMPHIPARWNEKKAFQFAALSSLAAHIAELEAETGIATGYRRTGRLMPIYTEDKRDHARLRAQESVERWQSAATGFTFQVSQTSPSSDWLSPTSTPFGYAFDTLAARIFPRHYIAALTASLKGRCHFLEQSTVTDFDDTNGHISFERHGPAIVAEKIVLAAGYRTFRMIEKKEGVQLGSGVKGQATLLAGINTDGLPVIYDSGVYVVPHEGDLVAVGSTSERTWKDPVEPDLSNLDFLRRAELFCPSLKEARIVEHWAGVRPKCTRRDPLVGAVPGRARTYVATGGFKISFGIAHRVADALYERMYETTPSTSLPPSFEPDFHWIPGRQRSRGSDNSEV